MAVSALQPWSIFVITAFCIIFLIGFTGNLLVLYALRFMKPLNKKNQSTLYSPKEYTLTPMERLITYLAATDLTASICNPLLYIYYEVTQWNRWDFGKPGCIIAGSVNSVLDTISCGLILTIMIERCIVLCFPFKHNFTRSSVRKAFASVILVSVIMELPYMLHLKVFEVVEADYNCSLDLTSSSKLLNQSQGILNTSTTLTALNNSSHDAFKSIECQSNFVFHQEHFFKLCSAVPATKTFPSKCKNLKNNLTHFRKPIIKCKIKTCTQRYHTCIPDATHTYLYFKIFFTGIRDLTFVSAFTICIYLIYGDMKSQQEALNEQSLTNAKKTLKILVLLSVIFGVLVLPKDIFQFIHNISVLHRSELNREVSLKVNSFFKVLQCSNCISNVFVYARLHTKFRIRMKELTLNISENISNQYHKDKGIPKLVSHNNIAGLLETFM